MDVILIMFLFIVVSSLVASGGLLLAVWDDRTYSQDSTYSSDGREARDGAEASGKPDVT
jgi:hypothetical protein